MTHERRFGSNGSVDQADRRLTAQGIQRRDELLACAARLFAERGYAETRVVDVCREAGVAKGLFYWYFDNKEALFADLVRRVRHELRTTQAAAMDPNADALERIRQGAEATVRFMAARARFFSLLEVENLPESLGAVLRQGTDEHVADVRSLITEGIAAGLIRDEDPTLLALGVVGTVGYYCHFHRTGRIEADPAELGAFVGRTVVAMLAAPCPRCRGTAPAARPPAPG